MAVHSIRLSSAEIGGLWATYLQENMAVCLLTYFLHHNKDEEIGKTLKHAYEVSDGHVKKIASIFTEEGIPIPDGFTEKDLDLTVPPLFHDLFGLSFVYSMCRMGLINTGFITSSMAREDVQDFFVKMVQENSLLYKESTTLMLSKGLYDRPPMIPYPKKVEYIEKLSYLSGFGKKRPLNVAEITEIFFNTERNYFSILLCMGLLQVIKDKEIHDYIQEGKKISEKQINTFNDILMREELLGNISTIVDVTETTVSPFSDKLVVTLFHALNAIDITMIGHALSLSMRTDLAAYYQKYILDILVYSAKGFDILVDRGWAQEPPHAPDRRDLQKLK
ncbi:hypothetical protein BABA_25476 [Neobacillus bataviensis LMG 21833]|uniref:Sugar isomerase n=1 Tax=Neobacillus bataviensis LMG 21833 TaxID=1117379 RepID=K6DP58_9BACI|nr:DUF3231 family protein [Neobacillus bataviensis]EKN62561.1 hypothetical protein BABA_25476 [Neobacillus bataviensis LMG 21833]